MPPGRNRRRRIEHIHEDYIKKVDAQAFNEALFIEIPDDAPSLREWINEKAIEAGWRNLEHAVASLDLPKQRLTAVNPGDRIHRIQKPEDLVRAAILLAKCSSTTYHPDGELIFSRARLTRKLRITDIKIETYYESSTPASTSH